MPCEGHSSSLRGEQGLGDPPPEWLRSLPWEVNNHSQKGNTVPGAGWQPRVWACPPLASICFIPGAPCLGGINGRTQTLFWTVRKGGGQEEGCLPRQWVDTHWGLPGCLMTGHPSTIPIWVPIPLSLGDILHGRCQVQVFL